MMQYKCPCCGGAITFDTTIQKMKCPYCDTEFEMETLAQYDAQLSQEGPSQTEWEQQPEETWTDEDGMKVYVCSSCGGSVVGDETLAATQCPFCGNPVILMGQFTGELRPDAVIPFKKTKEDAMAALSAHYKGKKLLPKTFSTDNHIKEIKGLYVPFWLFDTGVDANVRYRATRVRVWSDSDYNYTQTSFYSIQRAGRIAFEHVPVDGSQKMPDDVMESIEPFDFSEAVDFQTAYLSGFLANKYDVTKEDTIARANQRIQASTEDAFRSTVQGYATVTNENAALRYENSRARYALYPVWMLNTEWHGQQYMFAMNGQTGKFTGDLPMDKGLYRKWFFLLLGSVAAGVALLLFLLTLGGIL